MKKFSTIASALLLSLQAFLSTPLTVLAHLLQNLVRAAPFRVVNQAQNLLAV